MAPSGGPPVLVRPTRPAPRLPVLPRPLPRSLPDELPQLLSALTVAAAPGGTAAHASAGAVSKSAGPLSPAAPKGAAAGPEWLRKVAAREQQQAAWAKDEGPHWEAAMAAAVGAPAAGQTVAVPLLLDGEADGAIPESPELEKLMRGRLDLTALQRLTRQSGLAVFCSSTVRGCCGETLALNIAFTTRLFIYLFFIKY